VIGNLETENSSRRQAAKRLAMLHVITRFSRGGSEQRMMDIVAAVSDAEHVVVAGQMTAPDRLEGLPIRVVEIPALVRAIAPRRDLLAVLQVMRVIRQLRPAVVVLHQSKAIFLGRVARYLARSQASLVVSLSMSALEEAESALQRRLFIVLERLLSSSTDLYVCAGTDLAAMYALHAQIPKERMRVVRSSLDLVPFGMGTREAARTMHGLPDQTTIVYVGSFDERKGVTDLPYLLGHVQRRAGDITALLIGDGPLREDVVAQAGRLPGVTVRAPGHSPDVASYMHASDVLCLPSRAEGLPQVLVQAAAAGLPFVAYGVCGVRELLDLGATGVCVDRGDLSAMALALEESVRSAARSPGMRIDPTLLDAWSAAAVRDAHRAWFETASA
jgi:glycosyltransferase involved in cell wall biosynthesis